MLSYKEYDNAQAVEIVLEGRVSTAEFDALAGRLEAFIKRHGRGGRRAGLANVARRRGGPLSGSSTAALEPFGLLDRLSRGFLDRIEIIDDRRDVGRGERKDRHIGMA